MCVFDPHVDEIADGDRADGIEEGSDLIRASRIEIYDLEMLSYGVTEFPAPSSCDGRNSRIYVADISG